ncbi:hypothetical protein MMC15_004795 [Xylographa vitiligo]|nr:hypothetical protein [Xylographa vitiligo]
MLFQAYTYGRPAGSVHSWKGKASEDPLGEREETSKNAYPREAAHGDYDDDSAADADDEPECDENSDTGDDPGSNGNVLFDPTYIAQNRCTDGPLK